MLHPSMSELLEKVDNRYLLVNVAAKRARQIAEEAELNEVNLSEKPVKLALDDIVAGRIVNVSEADDVQSDESDAEQSSDAPEKAGQDEAGREADEEAAEE